MKKLTVTTEQGNSIMIGWEPPYILSGFEGYGEVPAEWQKSKSVNQDGVTYVDCTLGVRPLPLIVSIEGDNEEDLIARRQEFSAIFNPKNGTLHVEYEDEDGIKEINVKVEGVPKYPKGADRVDGIYQMALVELTAPNPYWRKTEVVDKPLYAWIPMHRFPHVFGTTTNPMTVFGVKGAAESIENIGSTKAPAIITITGYSDTPTIRNLTTDEYITINTIVQRNERIEISTDDDNLSIDYIHEDGTREDIYFRMALGSTLWKLEKGLNMIEYTTIAQDEFSTVSISYQELYVGI